jgi:signal transduction histidine kinase
LSGFIIWKLTNQQIIDPVLKIHSVIIDGSDIKNIDDLPINEIGSLGRALLHQKLQIEQRNIELKNVSDELNKETSLLKVLSHDLATPMMVVKVSAGQLKKSVESGERSLILIQRIVSQVTMIESVLGHVKEMKALETGKRRLTLFELTFGPIIQDIMITFKDRLDEKNITLDWPISDEETRLVADEISFRVSVISNLLINAIKFSERGGRIELRCREVGGQTRFDMRDYGPGIPLDIREHLFSTDYETTRKGSEGEDGTGFGMSIVRFYVTLYGGSVDFVTKTKEESSTDYGTTFTIILKSRFINNLKLSA